MDLQPIQRQRADRGGIATGIQPTFGDEVGIGPGRMDLCPVDDPSPNLVQASVGVEPGTVQATGFRLHAMSVEPRQHGTARDVQAARFQSVDQVSRLYDQIGPRDLLQLGERQPPLDEAGAFRPTEFRRHLLGLAPEGCRRQRIRIEMAGDDLVGQHVVDRPPLVALGVLFDPAIVDHKLEQLAQVGAQPVATGLEERQHRHQQCQSSLVRRAFGAAHRQDMPGDPLAEILLLEKGMQRIAAGPRRIEVPLFLQV